MKKKEKKTTESQKHLINHNGSFKNHIYVSLYTYLQVTELNI